MQKEVASNRKYNAQTKGKYNSRNSNNSRKKNVVSNQKETNYYIIPLFITLCIIPLIVRMKSYHTHLNEFLWYAEDDSYLDFFLFYKQWFFVSVSGIMAIIIAIKAYNKRHELKFAPLFAPLAIFGIMSLLSAIFSKYAYFSFAGSFEMFESVFAILGYCVTAYYAFLFIKDENDLKKIMNYLVVIALILSVLGMSQFIGKDLFATKAFFHVLVPLQYSSSEGLKFTFENNRVYLTLYNPNYVGVYVSLVAPIILTMLFFQRNLKNIILSVLAIIGLLISLVGARSQAGVIGLGIAFFFIILMMWRYLAKRYYVTIPVAVVLVIGVIVLNQVTDQLLVNRFKTMFSSAKPNHALTEMNTEDDCVSLVYNGNRLEVRYFVGEVDNAIIITDENDSVVATTYDSNTNSVVIVDERFAGISVGNSEYLENGFYIEESGYKWHFTSQTEDGTYYYFNRYGRLDKMITAPSAVFTGYEWFATARGYIWSRTIPVLKNYLFLGSGPDTFAMAFPQQDYLNFQKYGYGNGIITKPHNMYLQIWVQDGLIALLAFLAFYGMYFVSSMRLYIKGRFNSIYAQMGVAIFVGTIGYMVTGLTNDSSITTAPIYWALIGIGIAVNYKAKPIIMEEITAEKAAKANNMEVKST